MKIADRFSSLGQLNIYNLAERAFYQVFGMTNHALAFATLDKKCPFAVLLQVGDKAVQAVSD